MIAAALATCSPLLIWYSQEARSYEMLALFSGVSLLAFAYARASPTPRVLAAWVVASALALATHYYAVLAVVPEAVWLLWMFRSQRTVQVAVGVVGLCGLGLIPLAISQHGTGRGNWISHAPFGRRLGQIVPQFVSGFDGPAHSVFEPVAIAVVALSLVLLFWRSSVVERRGAFVAGGLALAGFVLSLLLVAVGFDDLLTRNMLAIWAACALLVAGGLAVPRPRFVGAVGAGVLCVFGFATAVGVAFDRKYERPDWRVVARALGTHAASGGRAILVQHYRDLLPLSLYVPDLKFWRGGGAGSCARVRRRVVHIAGERGLLLVGVGVQPVAVARAVRRIRSPASGRFRSGTSCSSPWCGWWRRGRVPVTPGEVSRALTTTHLGNDELLTQR